MWKSEDHSVVSLLLTFLWVWGIKFRVRSLHSKGLYPLGPLASPWVYTWIANVVLTSWTCVVLNNGFTRWYQLIDTCLLYWRNSIYTEEKRDVQAVRAQIQGLMVPHVLLPLHTNTVTWSLIQRTSRTAGWSTAVLRQGWTLVILPQEMLQQEC